VHKKNTSSYAHKFINKTNFSLPYSMILWHCLLHYWFTTDIVSYSFPQMTEALVCLY